MRDDAGDCSRAESRFSLVNICNLRIQIKIRAVLFFEGRGRALRRLTKTESHLKTEDFVEGIVRHFAKCVQWHSCREFDEKIHTSPMCVK